MTGCGPKGTRSARIPQINKPDTCACTIFALLARGVDEGTAALMEHQEKCTMQAGKLDIRLDPPGLPRAVQRAGIARLR